MNNINIIGTMTRDAELKYLSSGVAVANFAIAVNQDYKKQDGTKVEKTSFFDIKVIGKQSEIVNQYFSKGSRIGLSGELEQETWTAQDGTNRSKVVIKMQSFTFIDRKSDNQQNGNQNSYTPKNEQQQYTNEYQVPVSNQVNQSEDFGEELPF